MYKTLWRIYLYINNLERSKNYNEMQQSMEGGGVKASNLAPVL